MSSDSTANAFSPGRPRIMQIARGLAYSLVAVAVLCAAAVGVMNTAWFQNSLKETVKSRLQEFTGGRGGKQATGSDGTTNFPGPKGSSAAERARDELIDLTVGRLTLGQTQIEWNDRQLPFELRGQDVALLMRRSSGQRYTGTLSFTAKGIGASPWSLPQVHFTSHFELSREGLNVTSLTWESPGLLGRCSLELRDLASPRGVFTLAASAQVRQLGRSLRLAEWRSGTVNLEGHGVFGNGQIRAGR